MTTNSRMNSTACGPARAVLPMARLSSALQATPLMQQQCAVVMNRQQARDAKLESCEQVQVKQGKGTAVLPLRLDEGVPAGWVYVPSGIEAVKHLSAAFGKVTLEKVS